MSKPFSNVGGQGGQESDSIEADFVRRTHHEAEHYREKRHRDIDSVFLADQKPGNEDGEDRRRAFHGLREWDGNVFERQEAEEYD